ncbi:MAG TPA: hypothetical protein VHM92_08335 [Allosphingosinicella sp.]|nr:hypothetical protein [Allosphingosinicella sp.]
MGEGKVVTGGNRRKVQMREGPRGFFDGAKRQAFLDHLAACCNVTASAAAAGVGVTTVYDARRREPDFAEAWERAIETGYATLEALLIERAATGGTYVPGETPVPGPETIDTHLALDLLRLSRAPRRAPHRPRDRGGAPTRRADEKALADAICAKLEVLEKRRARRAAG